MTWRDEKTLMREGKLTTNIFTNHDRTGPNNVYRQVLDVFGELIGIGCLAHVLNNAIKNSADKLSFCEENIQDVSPDSLMRRESDVVWKKVGMKNNHKIETKTVHHQIKPISIE